MKKRLNSLQEKYIGNSEKTLSPLGVLKPDELARLQYPETFPGTNAPRLYNRSTRKAQTMLRDLNYVLSYLPDSYAYKMLTSSEFNGLLVTIHKRGAAVDKKQQTSRNDAQASSDPFSFALAVQMMNHAMQSIIDNMPAEFSEALKVQIYPFLLTLNSIAAFSQASKKGKRISPVSFPWEIKPSYSANRSAV